MAPFIVYGHRTRASNMSLDITVKTPGWSLHRCVVGSVYALYIHWSSGGWWVVCTNYVQCTLYIIVISNIYCAVYTVVCISILYYSVYI